MSDRNWRMLYVLFLFWSFYWFMSLENMGLRQRVGRPDDKTLVDRWNEFWTATSTAPKIERADSKANLVPRDISQQLLHSIKDQQSIAIAVEKRKLPVVAGRTYRLGFHFVKKNSSGKFTYQNACRYAHDRTFITSDSRFSIFLLSNCVEFEKLLDLKTLEVTMSLAPNIPPGEYKIKVGMTAPSQADLSPKEVKKYEDFLGEFTVTVRSNVITFAELKAEFDAAPYSEKSDLLPEFLEHGDDGLAEVSKFLDSFKINGGSTASAANWKDLYSPNQIERGVALKTIAGSSAPKSRVILANFTKENFPNILSALQSEDPWVVNLALGDLEYIAPFVKGAEGELKKFAELKSQKMPSQRYWSCIVLLKLMKPSKAASYARNRVLPMVKDDLVRGNYPEASMVSHALLKRVRKLGLSKEVDKVVVMGIEKGKPEYQHSLVSFVFLNQIRAAVPTLCNLTSSDDGIQSNAQLAIQTMGATCTAH